MKCVSQVIGPKNVDILYIKNLFLQKLIIIIIITTTIIQI